MMDFRYYDVFIPRGYGRKAERLLDELPGTDVITSPMKVGEIAELVRIMSELSAKDIERRLNRELGEGMATVDESKDVGEVEARRLRAKRIVFGEDEEEPRQEVIYETDRFKVRIDHLPGKESGQYEIWLMDLGKGRSGTYGSYQTREQALKHFEQYLKPELEGNEDREEGQMIQRETVNAYDEGIEDSRYPGMTRNEVRPGVRVQFVGDPVSALLSGGKIQRLEMGTIRKERYSDPAKRLVYVDWDNGRSFGVPLADLEPVSRTSLIPRRRSGIAGKAEAVRRGAGIDPTQYDIYVPAGKGKDLRSLLERTLEVKDIVSGPRQAGSSEIIRIICDMDEEELLEFVERKFGARGTNVVKSASNRMRRRPAGIIVAR